MRDHDAQLDQLARRRDFFTLTLLVGISSAYFTYAGMRMIGNVRPASSIVPRAGGRCRLRRGVSPLPRKMWVRRAVPGRTGR